MKLFTYPRCAAPALLATCLLLPGCGNQAPAAETTGGGSAAAETFNIVCTIGMVADIVEEVVGDRGTVTHIIGEGVDPHLYKTTRSDVARLDGADIVFYSGLMLEGKMGDALIRVARGGKAVYAVTELIEEDYLLEPPGFAGHFDPHVWMDVAGWMKAVDAVAASMAEIDPDHAMAYKANAERYNETLRELHEYALDSIASIPAASRVLITAHDAFNYFDRAYGIEVLGIQGISTESEAGLGDINGLVDTIVNRGVIAVFVETSVADRNVRALIEGAASRDHHVVIGGRLFSDAMGPPASYEGTYIGMIDHNVTTITRALGGSAPAAGLNGRLTGASHDG